MMDLIQKDIEKDIQKKPDIIEASGNSARFSVDEFLRIITPYLGRVFRETIKNCDWEKIGKEICVSDTFMLYRNGKEVHDAKVYYERMDSACYGRATKLESIEFKKFIKLMEENDFRSWRKIYE